VSNLIFPNRVTNGYLRFQKIIFIDASSQQQIQDDLETAIRSEGPEFSSATWKDAVAYLSDQKGWILFFDNADELNHELKEYLPNSPHGSIIITTRDQYNKIHAPYCAINAEKLNLPEALEMLHSVSGISPRSNDSSIAIVNELGLLALAVTQAGAYISHTQQIDTYLSVFHKHRNQLLQDGAVNDGNYNGSVYTTFSMSFKILPSRSIDFMKICAFFHHSLIPRLLFENSVKSHFFSPILAERYPPWEYTEKIISNLKGVFGSEWDDHEFKTLLDPIFRSSLMTASIDGRGQTFYNFHPLVQSYIRDLRMKEDRELYTPSAGQILLVGVSDWSHERVDLHWQLVPHINNLPIEVRDAHAMYSCTFAVALMGNKDRKLRYHCLDRLKVIQFIEGHTYRGILDEILSALNTQDLLESLESVRRKHWVLLVETLGPVHPDTIVAMKKLVDTLQDLGRLQEAEEIWQMVPMLLDAPARKYTGIGPAEDKLTLTIEYAHEILMLWQEIPGPQDPYIIYSVEDIVTSLRENGHPEEAEKIQREIVRILIEYQGLEKYSTIQSMEMLVIILTHRGQLEEAENIQREVVRLWKESQDPRDYFWADEAMRVLLGILKSRGKREEAMKLRVELVELWKKNEVLQDELEHFSLENFVSILWHERLLEEAERIQRVIIELQKERHGLRDVQTITAMWGLAEILDENVQLKEAEQAYTDIVGLLIEIEGPQSDNTTSATELLATVAHRRCLLGDAGQDPITWRRKLQCAHIKFRSGLITGPRSLLYILVEILALNFSITRLLMIIRANMIRNHIETARKGTKIVRVRTKAVRVRVKSVRIRNKKHISLPTSSPRLEAKNLHNLTKGPNKMLHRMPLY
jgi:tetratricopeptide (TPR) repeat protein